MSLFGPTLSQMVYLFLFILIGFVLVKLGAVPKNTAQVISKLENNVFIPALVLSTFIKQCTKEVIFSSWKLLLFSFAVELVIIPLSIFISKLCAHDLDTQKIYTYGLCFANFGFMGNAVVEALFPDMFVNYIIFTLPLWTLIYLWGVPSLLLPKIEGPKSFLHSLKSFLNPMFIAMVIGIVIGLTGLKIPAPVLSVISTAGSIMSPMAMLLTGITVAGINIVPVLKDKSIYAISAVRLIVFPLVFAAVFHFIPVPETFYLCMLCSLAMPLGLNTVVIPSAFGKDPSVAAGMAVISHLLSVITIPLIFTFVTSW